MFKTSNLVSWRCGINTRYPFSLVTIKKDLFFFVYCRGRVRKLLSFLRKSAKNFCYLTNKKNFVKHIENLPQHRKTLSAIIYRLPISLQKLRLMDYRYRPGCFEGIDYRYCFSTKRFIVPITEYCKFFRLFLS